MREFVRDRVSKRESRCQLASGECITVRWAGDHRRHNQQSTARSCGESRCVPTSGPSLGIVVSEEEFLLNVSCVVLSLCLGSFLMYSEKETSSKVFTSENSRTENSSQGPFP